MKCASHATLMTTSDLGLLTAQATYVRSTSDGNGGSVRIWRCRTCSGTFARAVHGAGDSGESPAQR